jgi:hypothetical protein
MTCAVHASPLFIAAQKGHTSICKKLLRDARIKVDDTTKEGTTPLLIAIQIGNLDEVELLLKAGANIELADNAGHTPLLTAASYGDLDVIEVLIQNGVDLQKKDHEGRTAHVILKEEFGEDLLKIAAENRHAADLDALHKAHRPTKATRRRSNLHDRINNKAHSLFAQFDLNNDKKLGENELRQCLVSLGCEKKLGSKKFDILMKHSFAKFDKNGDGVLDFEEFLRLYSVLMGQYKKMKRDKTKKKVKKEETGITTIEIVTKPVPKPRNSSAPSKPALKTGDHSAVKVGVGPGRAKLPPVAPHKTGPGQRSKKGPPPPPKKKHHSKSKHSKAPPPPAPAKRRKDSMTREMKITQSNSSTVSSGMKLPPIGGSSSRRASAKQIQW